MRDERDGGGREGASTKGKDDANSARRRRRPGPRGRKGRGGDQRRLGRTAGPGSPGSRSGSGRTLNVILSSAADAAAS